MFFSFAVLVGAVLSIKIIGHLTLNRPFDQLSPRTPPAMFGHERRSFILAPPECQSPDWRAVGFHPRA
jgi:hypothetical protein